MSFVFTHMEEQIVRCLTEHAGQIVSKEALAARIQSKSNSNTIEVLIGRIRKKLRANDDYWPIESIRNAGYRWAQRSLCP